MRTTGLILAEEYTKIFLFRQLGDGVKPAAVFFTLQGEGMRFLFILLFFSGVLRGNESAKENDIFAGHRDVFVSLGSACETASRIYDFGLRFTAFPFDWVLCPDVEGIILLLEEDFRFFLDETYLESHPYHQDVIVNSYYKIEFRHEWLMRNYNFWNDFARYRENLPEIQQKYQRRINRFKMLERCGKRVFFIRTAIDFDIEARLANQVTREQRRITYDQAIRLRNALKKHFESLDFKLVVINFLEELPEKFEHDYNDILEFKFTRPNKEGDYARMFQVLRGL